MTKSLNVFLHEEGLNITEGHICPAQKKHISEIFKKNKIKNVLEIGFNAGHSANCFLSQSEDINLTSVDICEHDYVFPCAGFISKKFPDRFSLMIGDSRDVLRNMREKFDFIFIDGWHKEDVCYEDIVNCKKLANSDTIIMLDDYCEAYGLGVTKAFEKCVKEGIIKQTETAYRIALRGWVLYKYV